MKKIEQLKLEIPCSEQRTIGGVWEASSSQSLCDALGCDVNETGILFQIEKRGGFLLLTNKVMVCKVHDGWRVGEVLFASPKKKLVY